MPSPFPGMDPYIESQQRFHVFHTSFINVCAELLNGRLASPYYATVEARVILDATGDDHASRQVVHRFGPDGAVSIDSRMRGATTLGSIGTATLEPTSLPQAVVSLDQPTQ